MSTTSIKSDFVVPASTREHSDGSGYKFADVSTAHRDPRILEMLGLAGWRKLALETFALLAVITIVQRLFPGAPEIPGVPHPYWIPVVLAACQYGVSGGMVAAVAASTMYIFGLTPRSAAQDFYAYTGMVTIQPAAWLATALILGGLRNLHINQFEGLAEQLAASRRRANDLSGGLERALTEINSLERRIAVDSGSAAALSRSLSQIDMTDRRTAATSFGDLFRVATGVVTFTLYLKVGDDYVPVWAIEEDIPRATRSMEPLPSAALEAMMTESAARGATDDAEEGGAAGRHVVRVPSSQADSEPLAAIVCELDAALEKKLFRRRTDELSRTLTTMLCACPDPASGVRP